eukprot:3183680-Karenia_brevis.AAC.1
MGPVETRLRSYGGVRGLVFGTWAEASESVDWLLGQIATFGAARRPGLATDRDPDDERVLLMTALRRRWGITAARANARLLLDRLAYVGRGASAAMARRGG